MTRQHQGPQSCSPSGTGPGYILGPTPQGLGRCTTHPKFTGHQPSTPESFIPIDLLKSLKKQPSLVNSKTKQPSLVKSIAKQPSLVKSITKQPSLVQLPLLLPNRSERKFSLFQVSLMFSVTLNHQKTILIIFEAYDTSTRDI